jgi:hypothetical protein
VFVKRKRLQGLREGYGIRDGYSGEWNEECTDPGWAREWSSFLAHPLPSNKGTTKHSIRKTIESLRGPRFRSERRRESGSIDKKEE